MVNESFKESIAREILSSRRFLIVFGLLVGIFIPIVAMSIQSDDRLDDGAFLTLTVLDSEMRTGQYFQNSSEIASGDNMNWYVQVHNGMNRPEYIAIKIKLLNSTQQSPNDASHAPSPESEIFNLQQTIAANSTWVTALNWTIASADSQDGYTTIKSVIVNGKTIDNLNIMSSEVSNFRMIVELWKYDSQSGDFTFAWSTSHETRSVWNQIWFNVKN